MNLEALDTPCLVLDRAKVAANAKRLREHLASLGVPLRLHVKTAKSLEATALVLEGRKSPITVSTLKEAEQFLDAGYTDILYAVGFEPHKLGRAQAVAAAGHLGLQHVGAEVGEQRRGVGAGDDGGDVEDAKARERAGVSSGCGWCHGVFLHGERYAIRRGYQPEKRLQFASTSRPPSMTL